MDIEKERADFKIELAHEYNMREVDTVLGKSFVMGSTNQAFKAWQAAKAHESEKLRGCVVVPVTCPDPQFADAIFEELKTKAFDSFGDDAAVCLSDIDAEKIWSIALETARGGK